MSCRSKTNATWFQAAKDGDMEYIKQNKAKYARTYDSRDTVVDKDVLGGYAAIHYAAMYGKTEIVKELLPLEYTMLTRSAIGVVCPGFSPNLRFKIQPQISCLALAILRKNDETAEEIYNYLNSDSGKKAEFIQASKGLSFNTAVAASLCEACTVSQKILDDDSFSYGELVEARRGELTAAMNGAYFVRLPVVECLKRLQESGKVDAEIAELLLQTDNQGQTPLQCAFRTEADPVRFAIKSENTGKIQSILAEITKKAFDFALASSNSQLKALAEKLQSNNDFTQLLSKGESNEVAKEVENEVEESGEK